MKKGVMQNAQQKDGCFKNRSNAIKKQPEYKKKTYVLLFRQLNQILATFFFESETKY